MKERFQVNFQGILKILSQHLYSSPDVFLRELLQNSLDAITARKNYDANFQDAKVTVELIQQVDKNVLIFEDNGIGLTEVEIEQFLASIGSSSKSLDVVAQGKEVSFIGQFGIGMLSCFTVSEKIAVITKSCKQEKALKWTANVDGTYQTEELEGTYQEGTKVFLEFVDTFQSTYTFEKIVGILKNYGEFLPMKIECRNGEQETIIGGKLFPWQHGSKMSMFSLGKRIFDVNFDFAIPLSSDKTQTYGVAYILPFKTKSTAYGNHHIYIKNMMITKEENHILPEWAFFVKSVVNSQSLVPTASRESLYQNEQLKQAQHDFGENIKDYFKELAQEDPASLKQILAIHNEAIKGLALQDEEFFDLIGHWIEMPTSQGHLSLQEIVNTGDTIRYVTDLDQYRQLLPIAKANNQLLVNTGYIYDTQIIQRISSKYPLKEFQGLTTESFTNFLGELTWEEEQELYDFQRKCNQVLAQFDCKVFLKKYQPTTLPALFYLSNQGERIRDMEQTKKKSSGLWGDVLGDMLSNMEQKNHSKLYLNVENALIQKLAKNENIDLYIQLIYVNALLMGHYPMKQEEMQLLTNNLIKLIELGIG